MEFSRIKNPFMNTEESCNIIDPVNSFEREKLLYLQKCLKENENCHSLLTVIESSINILLDKCIKELQIVNADIDLCMRRNDSPPKPLDRLEKRVLCAPYFKDDRNISSPFNEDVSMRNVQGFLNPYKVKGHQEWSELQKDALVKFIRNVEEEKWIETLKSCGMLHLAKVKEMTLKELIESRYDEYDWSEISVSCFKYARSPEECRRLWFLCLHPQINQEKWSEEENKKLKKLVLQYEGQDWDKMVRELGTKRSVFSSIVHFQLHLSEGRKFKWSEKEIDLLKYYVKLFTYQGFKQWMKIKRFIDGICLENIVRKWNSINRSKLCPTFSFEEDIVLLAGMRTFGSKFARIVEYLPDRDINQVYSRCEILKHRQMPKGAWSRQEDLKLINVMNKYETKKWVNTCMHFVNRNCNSVRRRSLTIEESIKKAKSKLPITRLRRHGLKFDPVNIPLLWESVLTICQENNISINNLDTSCVNIVHELSNILKPQMRQNKNIPERKFKRFSDQEYTKFFLGAFMLNENEQKSTEGMREIVHAFVQDVVVVLKLLDAKVNLPVSKELKNDSTISCQDKFIIKYLIKKFKSKNNGSCDVFLPPNSSKTNMVADEHSGVKLDNIHYLFPPNFSTLLAMRSLILNTKNQKEQMEGLTMQVDNFEWKEMYEQCPPRNVIYSENYTVCSKLWVQRVELLLSGVAMVPNPGGLPFIANGRVAKLAEFPWHVGIFKMTGDTFQQICGGNLVTARMIISAAHCFWLESENKVDNIKNYRIAAGKFYLQWDKRTDYFQNSEIENIYVHRSFRGMKGLYAADISVIALTNSFVINEAVRPICLDFDRRFSEDFKAGEVGVIVGWGFTENQTQSEELHAISLPYEDRSVCIERTKESFIPFLNVHDKFCVGTDSGKSVCPGDSGGGFAVKFRNGIHYYLMGVVSVGVVPQGSDECDISQYSSFTKISEYYSFIYNILYSK